MQVKQTVPGLADLDSSRMFFSALKAVFPLKARVCLDAFARNGYLTVGQYVADVQRVDCWELGAEHQETLRAYGHKANVLPPSCSYRRLSRLPKIPTYDMVVIDTPQGLHKDFTGRPMAEHFTFFRGCLPLLYHAGIVILYVNKDPYDKTRVGSFGYDEYAEYNYDVWMKHRRHAYGASSITEDQALAYYRAVVETSGLGMRLGRVLMMPCLSDVPGRSPYAFRLALEILRN